jgi:hypothetical protein
MIAILVEMNERVKEKLKMQRGALGKAGRESSVY